MCPTCAGRPMANSNSLHERTEVKVQSILGFKGPIDAAIEIRTKGVGGY
jgi:hypothetical protein